MNRKAEIIKWLERHILIRKIIRKILRINGFFQYKIRNIGKKVHKNKILFSSFGGRAYSCSPKAIYEYMIHNEKYKDFQYIWAFEKTENYIFLNKKKNTKLIKFGTKEFEQELATSQYWIVNYKLPDYIYPNRKQIYVQCWHGTPLKKLGYDLKNTENAMNSEDEIHEKYKIDAEKFKYLISPSKFATEKFITAWNLEKIGKEDVIIEEGYPRNDFLYNYKKEDIDMMKEKIQIPKNKKIILYAPTWRDDQHQAGVGYTYQTKVDFDSLKQALSKEYVILFRAHYLVANSFDFEKYQGFIYNVSNWDDINELYIISDILITDYSSVFFDYANLKRPIIFYMYDFEKYKEDLRGFYINISELPGEITKNEKELISAIKNLNNFVYDFKYQKFNQKYNNLDDGEATKRVINTIIE